MMYAKFLAWSQEALLLLSFKPHHYCVHRALVLMQPTSHAHLIKADRWRSRQWTPTCDEARVCEPVFGVVCVVAQVSDLHVAIVDAENKSQGKGDARCCFTPSD